MKHISLSRFIFLISYLYLLILPFSLFPFSRLEFTEELRADGLEANGSSLGGQFYGGGTLDFGVTYQSDLESEILDSIFKQFTSYNFENYFDVNSSSSSTKIREVFEEYEMYKYDIFKAYIHSLPGYREFIHEFHRKLDADDAYRKDMKNKYGHWFINHIRDEDDRTQREWEQEQQREREDEQIEKAAFEAEIAAKRVVQSEWQQHELGSQEEQHRKDQKIALVMDDEEGSEHVAFCSELFSMMESCEKFKLLHSFDEEFGHLADFCQEEIQEAYSYADAENSLEYEKHKARAQAAHKTLREVFSKQQQDYDLNENTNTYLSKLEIDSQNFVQFDGTVLQHQLHQELVETINDTSSLVQAHFDNFHINSIG